MTVFSVSMENIMTDYKDLEKGMQMTQKEYEARKHSRDTPPILKEFLTNSEDKLKKLQADIKTAEVIANHSEQLNLLPLRPHIHQLSSSQVWVLNSNKCTF